MRKKILFIIVGMGLLISLLLLINIKNRKSGIEYLEGQWKTTELTAISRTGTIYWSEEEYLGRSISIESSGRIERSIYFWPHYLYPQTKNCEYWKFERMLAAEIGAKQEIGNFTGWYDKYRDEEVEVVSFYQCEDDYKAGFEPYEVYIIFEDGSVQGRYYEGWYLIERFVKAKTNLPPEELYGTWDVERFVSYKDNRYVELHEVQQYNIQQADRKAYEQEKGINDELGISNEKIEVIVAELKEGDKEGVLDNEIVVIDR